MYTKKKTESFTYSSFWSFMYFIYNKVFVHPLPKKGANQMKSGQSVLSSVAMTEEKHWRKLLAVTYSILW